MQIKQEIEWYACVQWIHRMRACKLAASDKETAAVQTERKQGE